MARKCVATPGRETSFVVLQWDRASDGAEIQASTEDAILKTMLQWDRASDGAEIKFAPFWDALFKLLQWDRASDGAEIVSTE